MNSPAVLAAGPNRLPEARGGSASSPWIGSDAIALRGNDNAPEVMGLRRAGCAGRRPYSGRDGQPKHRAIRILGSGFQDVARQVLEALLNIDPKYIREIGPPMATARRGSIATR